MSSNVAFDRFYASRHVRILIHPSNSLETFDSTLFNYHLVSELADNPHKIRIREGRLEAHPPLVIAPDFNGISVEGLGSKAKEYLEFLRDNSSHLRLLQYGYHLKSDNFSEQIVTDTLDAVVERVMRNVAANNDKFSAVLTGLDEQWDVALVELWRQEVMRSAGRNIRELHAKGKLFQ